MSKQWESCAQGIVGIHITQKLLAVLKWKLCILGNASTLCVQKAYKHVILLWFPWYHRLLVVSVFWIWAIFWYNIFFPPSDMGLKSDACTSNPHSKQIWTIFQLQGWENTENHSWMMKMSRQKREFWSKQPPEWIHWHTEVEKNLSIQLQCSYQIWIESWHQSWCAEEAAWPEGPQKVFAAWWHSPTVCQCVKRWHLFIYNDRVLPVKLCKCEASV